jgi:ribosome-associated protein
MTETDKTTTPSATADTPAAPKSRRRLSLREMQDNNVPAIAASRSQPDRLARALEHARISARIADDNRAKDILLLDLRQATPLVDYFVIATATSRRLVHAIASEIDQEMKRIGERKLGMEGSEEGRWILIDYGDFVVHIFSAEAREYYALEEIWGDAPRLDWQEPGPAVAEPAPDRPSNSEI